MKLSSRKELPEWRPSRIPTPSTIYTLIEDQVKTLIGAEILPHNEATLTTAGQLVPVPVPGARAVLPEPPAPVLCQYVNDPLLRKF